MPKKNEFTNIDKFLGWYKSKRPETIYVVTNKQRYDDVMQSIQTLARLATESNPSGVRFTTEQDELIGTSICFRIISNLVIFDDMDPFREALAKADNFEVCTRTDGTSTMGIVYENVYELAPSYEEVNNPFPEFSDKK